MAQHDYNIANANGASVRSDINNALSAIASNNSGTTAPSTTFAYEWWLDTTLNKLKIRNNANSAWIEVARVDSTFNMLLPSLGTVTVPAYAFTGDENTGMWSPAADTLAWSVAGAEGLRLASGGALTGVYATFTATAASGTGSNPGKFLATSATYTGIVVYAGVGRTATSAAWLFQGDSDYDGTPDVEFSVRADGLVAGDQAYNTGADYAEFFEWEDGNPNDLPRVGRTVSLVGNKIKVADEGETVIGVVSARPTVVGDAAELRWCERYLRDDFGRFELETYLALDPQTGATVSLKRRIQNPAFDPNQPYTPRSRRKEWAAVGLMGKLRVRKNQVKGPAWIKMRDISADVEEWLVR